MKKPWTIASTSPMVTEGLERKCDGTHEHVEARGKDCKLAEDYTDSFAQQVHIVLARAAERSSSSSRPVSSTIHPICAAAVLPSEHAPRPSHRRSPLRFAPPPRCGCPSPACGGRPAADKSLADPTCQPLEVPAAQSLGTAMASVCSDDVMCDPATDQSDGGERPAEQEQMGSPTDDPMATPSAQPLGGAIPSAQPLGKAPASVSSSDIMLDDVADMSDGVEFHPAEVAA